MSSEAAIMVALIAAVVSLIVNGILIPLSGKHQERRNYMRDRLKELRDVRAELQYYQLGELNYEDYIEEMKISKEKARVRDYLNSDIKEHEREIYQKSQLYFGKAHAIMSSSDNPKIKVLAAKIMDPQKSVGSTEDKIEAINVAIEILAREYDNRFTSEYPPPTLDG